LRQGKTIRKQNCPGFRNERIKNFVNKNQFMAKFFLSTLENAREKIKTDQTHRR